MTVPVYVLACVGAIAVAYVSDKTKKRGVYLASFSCLSVVGFALLRWCSITSVRYFALYLVCLGAFPGGPGMSPFSVSRVTTHAGIS